MSSCLAPWEQTVLVYITIPETIVLILTTYGFISWIKTKHAFGFVTGKQEPKKKVEVNPSAEGFVEAK